MTDLNVDISSDYFGYKQHRDGDNDDNKTTREMRQRHASTREFE